MDGVWFEARLALAWRAEEFPDGETLAAWMATNTVLLRALATLDTLAGERDAEIAEETEKRLDRLEAKVDLALALLAQLVAREQPHPRACPAKVSASAIEWHSVAAPPLGNAVIQLHIDARLPQALQLPAHIVQVTPDNGEHHVRAELCELDEDCREWLERAVFRRHRRAIQATRGKTAN